MKDVFALCAITCFSLILFCSKGNPVNYPVKIAFVSVEAITSRRVFAEGELEINPITNGETVRAFLHEQYAGKSEQGIIIQRFVNL